MANCDSANLQVSYILNFLAEQTVQSVVLKWHGLQVLLEAKAILDQFKDPSHALHMVPCGRKVMACVHDFL